MANPIHDPGREAPARALRIETPRSAKELAAFVELYRRVFRYSEAGLNVRLLSAIERNGGVALGAWVNDEPAGFVFGFVAHAPDVGFYHYSQAAVVDDRFQGMRIGRALKLAQRDHVLRQGLTRMRWYFDPMRSRNAHFNLVVLGAEAIALERNLYGVGMGRDRGFPTHRLVADWLLDRDPRPQPAGGAATIPIPRDWDAHRAKHGEAAIATADRVADAFAEAFAAGLSAVTVRDRGAEAVYVLEPRR